MFNAPETFSTEECVAKVDRRQMYESDIPKIVEQYERN